MARDLYDVLGVTKDADEDAIRKAYRKLAAKYHPDRNPGKENEDRFKEINAAYEVVSDKDKRALYDEFGEESTKQGFDAERARMMKNFSRRGGRGGGGGSVSFQDIFGGGAGDFGDAFGDLFGRAGGPRQRAPRRAPDMEAQVQIDFVSALKGTMVELSSPDGEEPVKVRIPPGAADGSRLRIPGQGAKIPGAHPGDLLLTVHVTPHPFFKREGDDLHLELPISIVEAYEGAKVRIPTPEGDVTLKVPPRTQSGQMARLRGKGVARKGKS
ncbi:MAG TPA: DnaJ C-terminal domain-containing protein, partial [Polyangiaceae bacterium]|nr:DnaJ C-terminal domain-containing protein [Polyangiaceae bacterium]